MADVIREAVIRLGIEQIPAKLEAPDLSSVRKAVEAANASITKSADAVAKSIQKTLSQERISADKVAERVRKSQEAIVQATDRGNESAIRSAEAYRTVGEGAFTAARGVAFLAASNEESIKVATEVIAIGQGAFDLYKGSVDVVKGLADANKALSGASGVAAAAEASRAAATRASTAATVAATPAVRGLGAALTGPLGIAIAATTAAIGGGVALWRKFSDAGGSAAEHVRAELEKTRAEVDRVVERLDSAGKRRSVAAGNVQRRLRFADEDQRADIIQARLDQLDERRRLGHIAGNIEAARKVAERGRFSPAEEAAALKLDRRELQERLDLRSDQLQALRAAKLESSEEIKSLEKAIEAEGERQRAIAEKAGSLGPLERLERNQLLQRAEAGEGLLRQELLRLRELAPNAAGNFVSERLALIGRGLPQPRETVAIDDDKRGELERRLDELREREQLEVDAREEQLAKLESTTSRILELLDGVDSRLGAIETRQLGRDFN